MFPSRHSRVVPSQKVFSSAGTETTFKSGEVSQVGFKSLGHGFRSTPAAADSRGGARGDAEWAGCSCPALSHAPPRLRSGWAALQPRLAVAPHHRRPHAGLQVLIEEKKQSEAAYYIMKGTVVL